MTPDSFEEFRAWFDLAKAAPGMRLPEAACLSTISPDGYPESRMMLIKDFGPPAFTFFTNENSCKGRSLAAISRASLNFHWKEISRQVRIVGDVTRLPLSDADAYFATRPRESQIGAWASRQSEPLKNREELEEAYRSVESRFTGKDISRPPHWIGFALIPHTMEFWIERPFRLHDRFRYWIQGGAWMIERLSP